MPLNQTSLRVTEAYRTRMVAIRKRAQAEARKTWRRIDPDRIDATFQAGLLALSVTTMQRQAAQLSAGYLAAYVASETGEKMPLPPAMALTAGDARANGTDLLHTIRSTAIGVKAEIGDGIEVREALRRGGNRLEQNVGLATDEAAREALRLAMTAEDQVEGWQRAVKGTCGACMGDVAVETTTEEPSKPLNVHPNCQCVTEPVVTQKATEPGEQLHTIGMALQRAPSATAGAQEAFDVYRLTRYKDINGYLRGVDLPAAEVAKVEDWITKMDATFASTEATTAPMRLYRGLNDKIENLFPGLDAATPGKVIDEVGFSSTAASRSVAESFGPSQFGGDLLEMTVSPGMRGLMAGGRDAEVLLQRDISYIITGVRQEGGKRIIEIQVTR